MKIQRKYTMHADEILEAVQDWLRKHIEIPESDIPVDLHTTEILFNSGEGETLAGCKLEWSMTSETKDV